MEDVKQFNAEASKESSTVVHFPPNTEHGLKEKESEDLETLGRLLAERLDHEQIHPVLIFGGQHSGKSTLLVSLLTYLKTKLPIGTPRLMEEAFKDFGSDSEEAITRLAIKFFHNTELGFSRSNDVPESTKLSTPYFICLEWGQQNADAGTGKKTRIALLESVGEWYEAGPQFASYFQPLRPEIAAFLRVFQRGVSVIYLAPTTGLPVRTGKANKLEEEKALLAKAEDAIVGAMNGYAKNRSYRTEDRHLLLVSKWDAYTSETHPDWNVETLLKHSTTASDVLPFLERNYPRAKRTLDSLGVPAEIHQYCAGLITERTVDRVNQDRLAHVLDQYNFDLFNWFYKGASGSTIKIEVPAPPKRTILEKINDFLEKVLGLKRS